MTDAFKFVNKVEDFCVNQMTGSYAVGTIGLPGPDSVITSEAWEKAVDRIRRDFQQNHKEWYADLPTGFKRTASAYAPASAAEFGGAEGRRK